MNVSKQKHTIKFKLIQLWKFKVQINKLKKACLMIGLLVWDLNYTISKVEDLN